MNQLEIQQLVGSTLPNHQVRFAQMYILAWATIAVAASIGAEEQYKGGPVSTQALTLTGTVSAVILTLGIGTEALYAQYGSSKLPCIGSVLKWMSRHRMPERAVHVVVQLLTMTSTGIAFINMHVENWNWQFGFSSCLLILVFIYNVMYVPTLLLTTAAFPLHGNDAKRLLACVHASTPYVWKKSYVEERLMPSA